MWAFPVFPSLITRGGVVIRLVMGPILLRSGTGVWVTPWTVQAQVSRSARLSN